MGDFRFRLFDAAGFATVPSRSSYKSSSCVAMMPELYCGGGNERLAGSDGSRSEANVKGEVQGCAGRETHGRREKERRFEICRRGRAAK